MALPEPRMNTKFVGHHVSAGGFIFYQEDISDPLLVLLIKNKKNEYWIPKGHIEPGETNLDAAIREIEEEVGINKKMLTHIGPCQVHSYSFIDDAGHSNTKEIFIHVFKSRTKQIILEKGNDDILNAEWFVYEDAKNKILSYSQDQLEKARVLFEKHIS